MTEKKDIWDKIAVISSVLIPVSISIIGIVYSSAMKDAEIAVSKDQLEITRLNTKVEQAKLVHTFLESLTSEDESKKKLAIKAIILALPKEGVNLVGTLSETDISKNIREFASLEIEKFKLLKELNSFTLSICSIGPEGFTLVDGGNGQIFSESQDGSYRFLVDLNTNKVSLDILDIKPYAKMFSNEVQARAVLERTRKCVESMWLTLVKEGLTEKYNKALQRTSR